MKFKKLQILKNIIKKPTHPIPIQFRKENFVSLKKYLYLCSVIFNNGTYYYRIFTSALG